MAKLKDPSPGFKYDLWFHHLYPASPNRWRYSFVNSGPACLWTRSALNITEKNEDVWWVHTGSCRLGPLWLQSAAHLALMGLLCTKQMFLSLLFFNDRKEMLFLDSILLSDAKHLGWGRRKREREREWDCMGTNGQQVIMPRKRSLIITTHPPRPLLSYLFSCHIFLVLYSYPLPHVAR